MKTNLKHFSNSVSFLPIMLAVLTGCGEESGLVFTENASDGGRDAYKVETSNGTFYLEKSGGGLSSAIDKNGVDWIGWHPEDAPYQGFPNAVWDGIEENPRGYFHPYNKNTSGHSIKIGKQSDDSVILEVRSDDDEWETAYEFFPTHVTWHVKRKPETGSYWVLYEGWPGGSFEPEADWWMTSESPGKKSCDETHLKDIPGPEWIVFGDKEVDRVLFMLSHQDDDFVDVYFPLAFTVFGFGREGTKRPYFSKITEAERSFSIGFLETTDYDTISRAMNNILTGLPPN
jgi:hypothetical protein